MFIWVAMKSTSDAGKNDRIECALDREFFYSGKTIQMSRHLCNKWDLERIILYLNNSIWKGAKENLKLIDDDHFC